MQGILFDMYGVIIPDPHGGLVEFLQPLLPQTSRSEIYAHWLEAALGDCSADAFWQRLGLGENHEQLERRYLHGIAIDPAFSAAAVALRKQHRLALVSNDIARWNTIVREHNGLDGLFDAVIVSGEVRLRKPQPEIYRLALQKLDLPASACLLVDDRETNLAAARELGITTVLYGRKKAGYRHPCVQTMQELLAFVETLQ